MLLRNSISTTKKFFQKTIDNFKSFISKGGSTYEKLPKTPKIEACSKELDNFYVEFTHQWDSNKGKVKSRGRKKSSSKSQEFYTNFRHKENSENAARNEVKENVAPVKNSQTYELHPRKLGDAEKVRIESRGEKNEGSNKSKSLSVIRRFRPSDLCSRSVRETRLNMIYEKGNADHKQDVEEVLHYYSRLTCPAYLDLVDKFFKEICTEFLGAQVSTPANILRPLQ